MMSEVNYILPKLKEDEKQYEWNDSVLLGGEMTQLKDGRPIKVQVWAESGYTFVTYYLSVLYLEKYSKPALITYVKNQGIEVDENIERNASIHLYKDINNEDCWKITFNVGESNN
ncbi:hypothetical protein [Salipaludibacillus daqingensis]|uniref:hypothetical protein n=1 Tax=Salipaludibacillus daqingensis TaxID=3041001 RepID=UPI002473024D|nr:hypothetical protein [Salipaludibacillus daqingensis]